jgi:uncharacterized RDD family membrane protein YckC
MDSQRNLTKESPKQQDQLRFERIGFAKRLFAYNIDMTILMAPCIGASFLIESNRVLFFVCCLIVCLYHGVLDSSILQGTLGKYYCKIRVVDKIGQPATFLKALLRIVLKFISLLLLFSGFIMVVFRKDKKGLHDILSGTMVISKK